MSRSAYASYILSPGALPLLEDRLSALKVCKVTKCILQYFEEQLKVIKAAPESKERKTLYREVMPRIGRTSAMIPDANEVYCIIDHNHGTESTYLEGMPRFSKTDPATDKHAWRAYVEWMVVKPGRHLFSVDYPTFRLACQFDNEDIQRQLDEIPEDSRLGCGDSTTEKHMRAEMAGAVDVPTTEQRQVGRTGTQH